MSKISAGLLIYRKIYPTHKLCGGINEKIEVLLVHPGGPFFAKKDEGFWGIPKGEVEETEDLLSAAIRETEEELGLRVNNSFRPLGLIKCQKSLKTIHAWAVNLDLSIKNFKSNTFQLEWPPKSGQFKEFPEVDKAQYFDLETARKKINSCQAEFLNQLLQVSDN